MITREEYKELYVTDGHTGLPKCKCCGRIDTDVEMYIYD